MTLSELPLWFLRGFAIVFGLLWGSFLNVVIYRVPRSMSVVFPASHCPTCGEPVAAYDNLPVLSFLILRGHTRCCRSKLSVRYPTVELIGGGLSWAVLETLLRDYPLDTSLLLAGSAYLANLTFCLGLTAAAFIDLEHMFLPDAITLSGTALGLATATLRGIGWLDSLVGAIVGFLVVWAPFIFAYSRIRGRTGMGLGDAKLLMLAGAWFGWQGAVFALFAGAVQGTLGALCIYLVRGKIEEPEAVRADREELQRLASNGDDESKAILQSDPLGEEPAEGISQARLPFGPFLILGCFEYLFAGPWILDFVFPVPY